MESEVSPRSEIFVNWGSRSRRPAAERETLEPTSSHSPEPPPVVDVDSTESWVERLRRAQEGDSAAQTWVFRHFGPMVARWARVLSRSGSPDDVVQDVFLEVFRSRSAFRGDSSVESWLYRITRNRVLRRRRLVDLIIHSTSAPPDIPDSNSGFFDPLLRKRFWQAFGQLSPAHQETLLLVDMEERSGPEVAGMLGIPEGTVRSRLRDGRNELKKRLRKQGLLEVSSSSAA